MSWLFFFIYENQGCDGGLMSSALQYVADKGISIEEVYPYKVKKKELL